MSLRIQDPAYADKVRRIFESAAFIADLGIQLTEVSPGSCESVLDVAPRHLQQDRFIHAGVVSTMGDHTAGGTAGTLVKPEETVLTVEFKINLLRPAVGQRLRCRAQVLRHGRTLSVVESEIFARDGEKEQLVAKQMVTLAVVTLAG